MTEKQYKNPYPTVDIIINVTDEKNNRVGIVLIERKNPPFGWALPGGFVEWGESLEQAAEREAYEETGLKLKNLRQFHTYSDPKRDPRFHTITTVYIAEAEGQPQASDDAKNAKIFKFSEIPEKLCFDHKQILQDYFSNRWKNLQ